jgi:hypothetical protein
MTSWSQYQSCTRNFIGVCCSPGDVDKFIEKTFTGVYRLTDFNCGEKEKVYLFKTLSGAIFYTVASFSQYGGSVFITAYSNYSNPFPSYAVKKTSLTSYVDTLQHRVLLVAIQSFELLDAFLSHDSYNTLQREYYRKQLLQLPLPVEVKERIIGFLVNDGMRKS